LKILRSGRAQPPHYLHPDAFAGAPYFCVSASYCQRQCRTASVRAVLPALAAYFQRRALVRSLLVAVFVDNWKSRQAFRPRDFYHGKFL
jgi:hypothetical protein